MPHAAVNVAVDSSKLVPAIQSTRPISHLLARSHANCLPRLCERNQRRHDARRPRRRRRRTGRHPSRHRFVGPAQLPARRAREVKKKGFRATQITIEHEPEHKHRHLHHITAMIDGSTLTARQKDLAKRIFQKLAEAEAKVHGIDDRKGSLSRSRRRRFDRRHRRLGDRLRLARRRTNRLLARADWPRLRRNRPRPLLDSGSGDRRTVARRSAGRVRCRRRTDYADWCGDRRRRWPTSSARSPR